LNNSERNEAKIVTTDDAAWVAVAVLGKPRGNRGELTAIGLTSKPERFESLERVFLSGHPEPFAIEEIWEHKGGLVFKFEGVDSISAAETLHGCEVRVPISERVQLDSDEYFDSDLVGCEMFDHKSGERLGKVTALQEGGGAGLLVLNGSTLIPFARRICVMIDVARKRIEVELPEGLLDVNAVDAEPE
jgi:16S rRNA processing protein RimM